MPDIALIDQAAKYLADAKNVLVSNLVRFVQDLERNFKGNPPKLILNDECHYGSNASDFRYYKVFDYLEKENSELGDKTASCGSYLLIYPAY